MLSPVLPRVGPRMPIHRLRFYKDDPSQADSLVRPVVCKDPTDIANTGDMLLGSSLRVSRLFLNPPHSVGRSLNRAEQFGEM